MTAVGIASFGAFLAFMDSTVVNVAFPNIQASFPHERLGTLSWVLNSYNVVFAGLLVLAGRLADLAGRRRLYRAGLVVFAVSSAACAAATSVPMLIAFRVVQGAGAAMLVPASLAIVVHASSREKRHQALSIWAAAAALAAGLGPPIGGALVNLHDWRLVFLINVPLVVVAWAGAGRSVVESRAPGRRVWPDLRGALTLCLALGAVTFGIVQSTSWGWTSPATLSAFVVSAAALVATVHSSRHHKSPVLDPSLLGIRGFAVGNLVTLVGGLGLYAYLLNHILWLHYVWGYSLVRSGLAVAPGAVVAALVALPASRLAERLGVRAVVVPGAIVWAAAYLWYVKRVGVHPDFVGQWLPGQILSGIGVGATLPVAQSGGLATVPAGRYATASAVNSTARQIGGVMGIALLTTLLAHTGPGNLVRDLRHGWELAAWSFVAAAALGLLFGRKSEVGGEVDGERRRTMLSTSRPEVTATGAQKPPGLLADLPGEVIERVRASATIVDLPAGGTLFRAGETGDSMYILEAGRLQVHLGDGAVREVYPGSALGELALLTDAPRSATVVARRDSLLRRLGRDEFERVMDADPAAMKAVARAVARQLQESRPLQEQSPPAPKLLAVVALDEGVDVTALGETLRAGLASHKSVCLLSETTPDGLQRAERDHDHVLLVAGPDEPGADAAIRQADRAVLISSRAEPGLVIRRPADHDGPCDVVIAGPVADARQTARWHETTGCRRVYHTGEDPHAWPSTLRPLVDRLAQRSVGLVLAGGGARALAHLGILYALEEANVTVDRVAGASMGAMVATAFASGLSAAEVDRMVFDEVVVGQPFRDWWPSRVSLAKGERGLAMLRRCFGESLLEAMALELVVVSTDLYARAPVYHRRGPVVDALAASMSLPVLFPPRKDGRTVLVDGSLTDNSPTAAFTELPEGPVLEVQIGGASIGGHRTRLPSIGETLMRVMLMGSRPGYPAGQVPATVTVMPDTRGIGLLEFHQIDAAREAGLQAGRAAVAALLRATDAQPHDGVVDVRSGQNGALADATALVLPSEAEPSPGAPV
ncbi:MAG TPA: MFS transporter [Acidimicrobiales bacterium]|nr:MFS transporter [Acidimicrobiales bacterium]